MSFIIKVTNPHPTRTHSPEQAFLDIVSQIESKTYVTDEAVGAIYDTLQPITDADFLTKGTGEWKGHSISTDHPIHKMLVDVEWAGKVFRSVDDVDPIMVYDEEGKREFLSKFGHAQVSISTFSCGCVLLNLSHVAAGGIVEGKAYDRDDLR